MALNTSTKALAQEEIKMDMTPIIDMSFLLLIFFLCTLNMSGMEGLLLSYLPKNIGVFSSASKKDPQDPTKVKLSKVSPTEIEVLCGGQRCTGENKFELLRTHLEKIAQNSTKAPIIIMPQSDVQFDHVIQVVNTCHKINKALKREALEIRFHISKEDLQQVE